MNIPRLVVEKIPSARHHLANVLSKTIYQQAFKELGTDSVIVSPLKLKGLENISIGRGVTVYEGSWIQAEGGGTITIGDNTYMGHRVHVHAVGHVRIGKNVMITDGVTISTGSHRVENRDDITSTGDIYLDDNCFIGEKSIILGGVTIGAGAVIGAGSVVTKDVAPGATVAGVPARPLNSVRNK